MGNLGRWASVSAVAIVVACRAQTPAPAPTSRDQAPAVAADGVPALPVVNAQLVDGRLTLSEGARDLLVPIGPVLDPTDPGVKGEVASHAVPGGVDLLVTFSNLTDEPRPVTDLSLGLFAMDSGLRLHDMRLPFTGQSVDLNTYIPRAAVYPLDSYSPAVVFADSRLAVGVSVAYPVLAYRHDVELTLMSPRDLKIAGKRAWMVKVGFSKGPKDKGPMRPGTLAPRESRRYTVHLRAAAPQEWMRTLAPYRAWFRAQYGPVRYTRDGGPVAGFEAATVASISEENPAGWVMPFRPDQLGWTNVARFLAAEYDGWPTVLIGNPSGLYDEHRQNNPPFQFTSPWLAGRSLQTATDQYNGFPSVVKLGKKIALRWGHAASIARGWNPAGFEPFDPANTEHVKMAFGEMDLAVKAGASTVMLDSFSHRSSPVWNLAPWLEMLRVRYPDVRFVASSAGCDLMHALVPICMDAAVGTQKATRPGDLPPVAEPFAIADFLLPGHETWACVRLDGPLTDVNFVEGEAHRLAGLGYVPFVWSRGAADVTAVTAAPTWEKTVPRDLRLPAGPKPSAATQARTEAPAGKQGGLEKITVRSGERAKPAQPGAVSATEQQRLITEALQRLRSTSAKANAEAAKKPRIKVSSPGEQKPADTEKKNEKER